MNLRGAVPSKLPGIGLVGDAVFELAGVTFLADLSGALLWAAERLLVVSDLHLEKGSSFAKRGTLLPPFDTAATLSRLAAVIGRHDPRTVIALGDSFHDRDAHLRLSDADRLQLATLQTGRDWIWISGNHDPALPRDIGGTVAEINAIGAITFRHEPTHGRAPGEIAGHLHPVARVFATSGSTRRRTTTPRSPTSTPTGPVTPAASPATSPADSATTATRPRSSSLNSPPRCGAPNTASAQ